MNFAPDIIQQSCWVTRRAHDQCALRPQLRQVSYSYRILAKGPILAGRDDSDDFGAGLLSWTSEKRHSLAHRILVFPEPFCQGLIDDRHIASFGTLGRS